MATIRLRPTFDILVKDEEPAEVWNRVQLSVEKKGLDGQFRDRFAMISMVESERHFWSPWLHLDLRHDDESTTLHGRFSPHPSIWTALVFGYLVLAVIAFFGAVVGYSQWLSGEAPWGCLVIPIVAVLALLVWGISQVGQRLAHDEMVELKRCVENAVEN